MVVTGEVTRQERIERLREEAIDVDDYDAPPSTKEVRSIRASLPSGDERSAANARRSARAAARAAGSVREGGAGDAEESVVAAAAAVIKEEPQPSAAAPRAAADDDATEPEIREARAPSRPRRHHAVRQCKRERPIDGVRKCPSCADTIVLSERGCSVVTCRSEAHGARYFYFCYHCGDECPEQQPCAKCPWRNDRATRLRVQQIRNAHAAEHPIDLCDSDD